MRKFNKYDKQGEMMRGTTINSPSVIAEFHDKEIIGGEKVDVYLYSIEFETEGEYLNYIKNLKSAKT